MLYNESWENLKMKFINEYCKRKGINMNVRRAADDGFYITENLVMKETFPSLDHMPLRIQKIYDEAMAERSLS